MNEGMGPELVRMTGGATVEEGMRKSQARASEHMWLEDLLALMCRGKGGSYVQAVCGGEEVAVDGAGDLHWKAHTVLAMAGERRWSYRSSVGGEARGHGDAQ